MARPGQLDLADLADSDAPDEPHDADARLGALTWPAARS